VLKAGTAIRLGNIKIVNKRSRLTTISNTIGVFNIAALAGDTLHFESDSYLSADWVVTDLTDKIIYLQPVIQLAEVVIKENSLITEIMEAQKGYRRKSVFYTGTPHYYYLVLKPMTFIYENFKSEVKNARRFNKMANLELASSEVAMRFNNAAIKQVVPIKDEEVDDFRTDYAPTPRQLQAMNDYDLINYIRDSYANFKDKR